MAHIYAIGTVRIAMRSHAMPILLLGTNNPGKQLELRSLLSRLPLDLREPSSLSSLPIVEEAAADYAANARLKALTLANASGLWTLADDSGLEVEALGGAPGARSARLAGPGRSNADRRRLLLQLLRTHPRPWKARFCCVLALASPQGEVDFAFGSCAGEIISRARGRGGFGYDPIFLVAGTRKTMAQLDLAQKNRISHRARAMAQLLPMLTHRMGLSI
jgi:XTP/dITP diphosphohydrolase